MAQIPKGRLVENPHKPICRDCAVYFSITVSCPSIAGKTGKSVHTMHWGGPTISQIESWRVASEGTRNVDIVDIASGDQPMSASRKPKTSHHATSAIFEAESSTRQKCHLLYPFEVPWVFYQPSTIINYLRLVKIIIDYLSLAILNKLPSLKLTANAPRSSTSTDRRSGRWWWVTSMCSCGILWTWINVCWIYYN